MGWEISVWHEVAGEKTRVIVEAGPHVPDEVISHLVGAYWLEEVQLDSAEWDASEEFEPNAEDEL